MERGTRGNPIELGRTHVANDNHDASRMDITGRCLAMRVGKRSHNDHLEGFNTGAMVLGHQCLWKGRGGVSGEREGQNARVKGGAECPN